MLKSTLLDIIRTFSKEELNKFEDFLRSPYFNKKDFIVEMFLEIKKYFPEFRNENLKRELVWKKLFPEKEFNYGIMKNMIYELVKMSEKFITLESYGKNEFRMFNDLIEEIDNRNLEKILSTKLLSFDKHFNIKNANESSMPIHDYYQTLSKIYWLKVLNGYNDSKTDFKREKDLGTEDLIYSFLINFIKVFDNLRIVKFIGNESDDDDILYLILQSIDTSVMKQILEHAKQNSESTFKILNCYYSMYKSLSSFENPELL